MRLSENLRLVTSITLIAATTASCQKHSELRYDRSKTDLTPVDGGTYVEASIGDASFLNPLLSTDSASNDIISQVFNGLVKFDKDIKLIGDLAESWKVEDG